MKQSDLNALRAPGAGVHLPSGGLEIANVRLLTAAAAGAAASPFEALKYEPDLFKCYVEFDICHSFPQITGPTMHGAYLGYHPAVLAANHGSLRHQWMNLRHLTAANAGDGKTRDRIVGCIVATHFPAPPPLGWKIPEKPEDAPCIKGCAVLFKLAEGMNRVIGDHQTSRQPWSVSIEVDATLDNVGIYQPSTREIWPLATAPDDLLEAVTVDPKSRNLVIGRARGEQLAFAYGHTNGKLHYRGVGMTPRPAEKTAKITSITAEDGSELFAIAAEEVNREVIVGATCTWQHYRGTIHEIKSEGKMAHPTGGWSLEASESDPALKIYLSDGTLVMKRFSEIELAA